MLWKLTKTYALAAFLTIMLAGVFIMLILKPNGYVQANDCLPGYEEIYFGHGAYACQKLEPQNTN
jgi:hypothetical protein